MRRRRRALLFGLLSLLATAVAAIVADRYGASAVRGYGPLRPVVVLAARMAAGQRMGPQEVGSGLAVRRVPARFVPAGALLAPEEALGLVARAPLPAGSYLLAAQLAVARRGRERVPRLAGGRHRVEISVSGADALPAAGVGAGESKVDVVVTSEPTGAGPGRTFIAAANVPLLALRPGPEGAGPGTLAAATLGLTKGQALRLIAAESFARKVTLLPEG
jgi:Flp pilus assembly protein CpaB